MDSLNTIDLSLAWSTEWAQSYTMALFSSCYYVIFRNYTNFAQEQIRYIFLSQQKMQSILVLIAYAVIKRAAKPLNKNYVLG